MVFEAILVFIGTGNVGEKSFRDTGYLKGLL